MLYGYTTVAMDIVLAPQKFRYRAYTIYMPWALVLYRSLSNIMYDLI